MCYLTHTTSHVRWSHTSDTSWPLMRYTLWSGVHTPGHTCSPPVRIPVLYSIKPTMYQPRIHPVWPVCAYPCIPCCAHVICMSSHHLHFIMLLTSCHHHVITTSHSHDVTHHQYSVYHVVLTHWCSTYIHHSLSMLTSHVHSLTHSWWSHATDDVHTTTASAHTMDITLWAYLATPDHVHIGYRTHGR